MLPVVATLLANGLNLIGNAVMAKGKEWVEEKVGVKLSDDGKIPESDLLKLKQAEMDHEETLLALSVDFAKAELEAAVKNASDVNETMRQEAKSEHWPQWSWRPFIGFSFGLSFFFCSLLVCILAYQAVFQGKAEAIQMIPALVTAFAALFAIPMPILGVAAWHRGKQKIQELIK